MKKYSMTEKERQAYVHIRRGYCHTRADIARHLNVSRPTASIIVEKLIALHAVCETGLCKPKRGKAPINIEAEADFQYSIGLDLGYSRSLVGVLLDGKNRIIQKACVEYNNTSLDSIHDKSLEIIEQFTRTYDVCGIGISLTGIVNSRASKVVSSVNPIFDTYPIHDLFEQWTSLPVCVSNRSRTEAFSEYIGGAANLEKNFLLCSLGESIDAAFFFNDTQFIGPNRAAGAIHHIRLKDGRTLGEALGTDVIPNYTEDELVDICADGLSQLTNIVDLRDVVLSGRFTDFGNDFLRKLNAALSGIWKYNIVFSNFGKLSAARGSAMTIAEYFLAQNVAK
ncbi:MAG: ROK family transcriptional regulator [Lentisphaeria bacterium]|nr:ROK family transcriptional regulator [Lentisphaeria bacterium]